jgi:ABC-type sugar transport system ATPase subunit
MSALRLQGIEKIFAGGVAAVAGVDLEVNEGELMVLLGPSGCGKSTLLRIVAGIETPTRGRVILDGRDVTDVPPQKRDVAMVFQSYALYPHMTVRENLSFGLRMRGMERRAIDARVAETAEKLGLTSLLARRPAQLSGGQRQRVALGRAIVRRARVFLMDEPLSNLDLKLRVSTRTEIARLQDELQVPMLYVTHDQEEAMTLGDRVVVMDAGRVLQVGPPREIYLRPASLFVAGFVGSPAINVLSGSLRSDAGAAPAEAGGAPADLGAALSDGRAALRIDGMDRDLSLSIARSGRLPAGPVAVGIRPEDLEVVETARSDLSIRLERAEPLGREWLLHGRVLLPSGAVSNGVQVLTTTERRWDPAEPIGLRLRRERIHFFDPETGKRLGVEPRESGTPAGAGVTR